MSAMQLHPCATCRRACLLLLLIVLVGFVELTDAKMVSIDI